MSRLSVINFLSPSRIKEGLARRGFKGALLHGVRRLGTALEYPLVGPYLLSINPNDYLCNHACPMCWLQHRDAEQVKRFRKRDRESGMQPADYEALFDSMPPGFEEVNIVGGGEPLVHPGILEIMDAVKRRRLRGWLITNGTLLKEDVARRMVEMRWDVTRVSVHAGDAETHRRIHGVERFEILRENLKTFDRLRRATDAAGRCRFIMLHVLQRGNIDAIDRLFAFAEEVGVDEIDFLKIIPYDKEKWLTADELRRTHAALSACLRDTSLPSNADEILQQLQVEEQCASAGAPYRPAARCSVGFDQAFITAQGDVMPCCFSDEVMGNVRREPFGRIWKNPAYRDFRRRLIKGRFAHYCISNRCSMKGVLHD